jgi:exodeoxyribonuclease VII large subunit
LNAVSPLATLERGYAIVSVAAGAILRDAADAPPGTQIEARLAHGSVRARVEGAS